MECMILDHSVGYVTSATLEAAAAAGDYEFGINGYDIHRCDRNEGRGGGTIIYSKLNSNFNYERIIFVNDR